jgi:hypothetical protein
MSIESRIKETEDLLVVLKSEQRKRDTLEGGGARINLQQESEIKDFWQSNILRTQVKTQLQEPVQTPIGLEKENLIRKFTSDLYQTVDIECREMLKVFDFAEDFINKMKEEKQ